jgi:subtilisin family serine protease
MAKKTSTRRSPEPDNQSLVAETELPVGPTGRFLITMAPGSQRNLIKTLKDSAGLNAASTADFDDAKKADIESLGGADALILEHLSVAVVSGDDAQRIQSLEVAVADDTNPIVAIEPEEYVQAIDDQGFLTQAGRDYVRGYRDGVAGWAGRLLEISPEEERMGGGAVAQTFADTPQFTWGLQATRMHTSTATGAGIRVAVLDTGFFSPHPDFAGRQVIAASFVGQPVQDGHGHGTHCIGTSLGDRMGAGGVRRYGCARQGVILVGKVLSNAGSGADGGILAGINWAIQNGARVISMSLGAPVVVGTPPTVAYENAGRAALNAGSLIIAAAGNSGLSATQFPVGRPANSPSIMAVAAVDQNLQRAPFSCRAANPNGGEVNIAGPGVAVFSSTKIPPRYAVMSGTSMATPHVAGIAALWSQRTGARGTALWQQLISTARAIGQPAAHVGRGLVQAPQ